LRAKKRILLIDADEDLRARRRFVLATHAYAVEAIASPEKGAAFGIGSFDLIIAVAPVPYNAFNPLARRIESPTLLLAEKSPLFLIFDRLVSPEISMAEQLEVIKIMCMRKRGPRKSVVPSLPEVATA
jgi:hypothetical protein